MSKSLTLADRATRNIRVLLDLIGAHDNFTAKEMEDLFAKSNKGDIWIEGSSVEEFLASLCDLGDLVCVVDPYAVIYARTKRNGG